MKSIKEGISVSSQTMVFVSVGLAVISMLWSAFNGYGKDSGRLDAVQADVKDIKIAIQRLEEKMEARFEKIDEKFEKIDQRFDKLEIESHKTGVRVTALEQKNP